MCKPDPIIYREDFPCSKGTSDKAHTTTSSKTTKHTQHTQKISKNEARPVQQARSSSKSSCSHFSLTGPTRKQRFACLATTLLVATGGCRRAFYFHRPSLRCSPSFVRSWSNPATTITTISTEGGGSGGVRRGQGGQDSGTLRAVGAVAVLEGQYVEELAQGDRVHGRAFQGGLPTHVKRGKKHQDCSGGR